MSFRKVEHQPDENPETDTPRDGLQSICSSIPAVGLLLDQQDSICHRKLFPRWYAHVPTEVALMPQRRTDTFWHSS